MIGAAIAAVVAGVLGVKLGRRLGPRAAPPPDHRRIRPGQCPVLDPRGRVCLRMAGHDRVGGLMASHIYSWRDGLL